MLLLTIDLPNAKDVKLILEPKGRLFFSATRGVQNIPYEIDIDLYDSVNVNESTACIGLENIVYLVRKEQQKWWIRLVKKEGRTPWFIEIDLDRWQDGEEQGELGAADQIVKVQEFEKKAEKKLSGWGIFGSKHEDVGELYEKAANCYKLAKSWNQAGAVCVKLAQCYLKGSDGKYEAGKLQMSMLMPVMHSRKQTTWVSWFEIHFPIFAYFT